MYSLAYYIGSENSEFRLDVALVLILVTALIVDDSRRLLARPPSPVADRYDTDTSVGSAGEARLGRLVAEERLACKA